jgi:hypothetical protein
MRLIFLLCGINTLQRILCLNQLSNSIGPGVVQMYIKVRNPSIRLGAIYYSEIMV